MQWKRLRASLRSPNACLKARQEVTTIGRLGPSWIDYDDDDERGATVNCDAVAYSARTQGTGGGMPTTKEVTERVRALAGTDVPLADNSAAWAPYHERRQASAWFANATAAIHDVFRSTDSLVRRWRDLEERTRTDHGAIIDTSFVNEARGILDAALERIEAGHVESFRDAIRVDTEHDLLDQAERLCDHGYAVAGAVLAGGALETHLRALCERYGLTITGEGSISKYNGVVAQARNGEAADVYDKTDGKSVEAWGGLRNDAAHDPLNFKKTGDDVKGVIDGIRQFIQRTAK